MIKEITEINFPSYATLSQATVTQNEMGDRTIEASVKIDGGVAPDFSFDWELEYRGERYIHPLREPQAAKDNQSPMSRVDLTFYEWAIYQMKRYYFVDMATTDAGTAVADKYEASLGLDLVNFVTAFNKVLNHYFGGKILMQIPAGLNAPRSFVEISYSYIWDVLQSVYDVYGVRWNIEYNSANDTYYIKVGFPATELTHTFEYGYKGGLISFERQIQDSDVRNIILGRGGERNLPYLYFKDYEQFHPNNPSYSNQGLTPDPDAIPELENIQFTELRGYTFRCYIQGWKTNLLRQLRTADGWVGEVEEYDAERGTEDWAYAKGHTDTKFNPTEYVKDDESIEKYGEMWGSLEKNDDIYPSIQNREAYNQGVVGAVVAVEPILSDDTEAAAKAEAMESTVAGGHIETDRFFAGDLTVTVESEEFEIPEGLTGNVYYQIFCLARPWQQHAGGVLWPDLYGDWKSLASVYIDTDQSSIKLVDVETGQESSAMGGVVAGKYRIKATLLVHSTEYLTDIDCGIQSVRVVSVEADMNSWKPTFDIWIKNIWGTTQGENESDAEYIMRVWGPICGDRTGGEASVVFSSGWLSSSSDYEFPIIGANVLSGGISVDRSREITQGSHVYQSEWKLTLAKSDAELATTGLWIPSTRPNTQAVAGDNFFFIGIDMPHDYVVWAEQALDEYKTAEGLNKLSTANPSWVINFDKVRVHTPEEEDYGVTLASQIAAGAKIHITDPRFTPDEVLDLYVQSLTIEWVNDGKMIPNISVVLSERIRAAKNPVKMLQSDVRMLSKQYVSLETVEETIEQIASKRYLTKTGAADTSYSPTSFASKVTSVDFRQGAVGGEGWGSYADGDGNSVIEMDRLIVRKEMLVNSLVINQAAYIGGMQIISAASVEVSQVIERDDFYECIFDQRRGSIGNNFVVDDIVYCSRWDSKNSNVKYYRRKVVAVGANSVSLSKSVVDGEGVPEVHDNIIQYGNYTDTTRQYVIIRDVIGGGYERMLQGLNSVTANGKEYYLAGRIAGQTPEWFVGDRDGQYAKYKDGILEIRGNIYVGSSKTPLQDLAYLASTLGDDGSEGLILAKQMSVYNGDRVMGGINGIYDGTLPHGGIAAWYGGSKIDHEAQPSVPNYATSLFRMDGTGYLAGGHISWAADGAVTLDATKVSLGGDATLNQLYQWIIRLRSLISIDEYQEGKWAVKVNNSAIDDDGTLRSIDGLYSPGFVSAGGIGSGGGEVGGINTIYFGTKAYQAEEGHTFITIPTSGPDSVKDVLGITGLDERVTELERGSSDKTYVYEQGVASREWVIQHGLGKKPSVTIVNSSDIQVLGDIIYVDNNTVKALFSTSFSGRAYLN